MNSVLALIFAFSSAAEAAPTQTLSVRPARLIWPTLDARYESALGDQGAWFVDGMAGRYNPVLLRVVNGILNQEGSTYTVKGTNFGVGGGYTYHFKDFTRGWGVGAIADVERFALSIDGEGDSSGVALTMLSAGAQGGWKRAWDSGFTLGFQAQLKYGRALGVKGTGNIEGELSSASESGLVTDFATYLGWSF
ncbi:MAG: hypothetical protein JNM72_02670 [Deltaproteobacteria bacterium]|nr:hypothetical protein [Deltaproteobacteria bacterium]